jgi:hypothetical protein
MLNIPQIRDLQPQGGFAKLHGHPRRHFGEVDAEAAFTGSRAHVIRRAASGVPEKSLDPRLRMLADRAVVERHGTVGAFRLQHLRTLPFQPRENVRQEPRL